MSPKNIPNNLFNDRAANAIRFSCSLKRSYLILVFTFVALLLAAQRLYSITPVTEVVVKTGDPAPDGDGAFGTTNAFTTPVLNNHGSAGFRGFLDNTTFGRYYGLFLGNGATLLQVARRTDPAFGGNFLSFHSPAVNDSGQLLFISDMGSNGYSLIRSESQPGAFSQLLYEDQPAHDNNGTLFLANANQRPAFNQSGATAFTVGVANTAGGSADDSAIYRSGAEGNLVLIVREGQNVPGGNGEFDQISAAAGVNSVLNESGQVAFLTGLIGTSGGNDDNAGVYRGDGTTLTEIARAGELLLGGGTLEWFGSNAGPDLNNSGEVVFPVSLDGNSALEAIFKGSGGALTQIARSGQTIPNSADIYSIFHGFPRINNSGQVAFVARADKSPGPGSYYAIFRTDGNGANGVVAARNGEAPPNGLGVFSGIHSSAFTLNNAGQIAFKSCLDLDPSNVTPCEEYGIFFFDQTTGLVQVARENDPLLGSTITELRLAGNSQDVGLPDERSGLNDHGQVAFGFTLEDGREGIAIWSPTLKLLSAVSRKTHNTAGTFDINLPLSSQPGIECRTGAAGHTLVFTFTNNIVSGNATVTAGVGSVSGNAIISGNTMTVNLTGVSNAQKITVRLSNVTDTAARVLPNKNVSMNVLFGDTNGNKAVNASDIGQTKARAGASVSGTNFRNDVTANGAINSSDIAAVKSKSGTGVP